jgi:hypothetical protein
MSIAAYIPGTHEHAKRKHVAFTRKLQKGHDVLVELQWSDGTVSFEPGEWKPEFQAVKTVNTELWFFARGEGSRKHDFGGATIVHVYVPNASLMSVEGTLAAERRDMNAERKVTDSGAVLEQNSAGEWERVDLDGDADPNVAADGGAVDVDQLDVVDKILPMAPPQATVTRTNDGEVDVELEFDYDGEVISWKTASDHDPNPVDQNDLQAVFEHVRNAETDPELALKWAAIGLAAGALGVLGIFTLLWFKGKVDGGSGGGTSIALTINFAKFAIKNAVVGVDSVEPAQAAVGLLASTRSMVSRVI